MINKTYGEMTVLNILPRERDLDGKLKRERCLAECSCGNTKSVMTKLLRNGNTKSCGCLQGKAVRERHSVIGKTFGRLYVYDFDKPRKGATYMKCQCECGIEKSIGRADLISGHTKSCGCLQKELLSKREKHYIPLAIRKTRKSMLSRCYNVDNKRYKDWGGRGIRVCDRWIWSSMNFYEDMGDKPSRKHSIDRIDNDGDYSPENCKWSTAEEQSNNQRVKKAKTSTHS